MAAKRKPKPQPGGDWIVVDPAANPPMRSPPQAPLAPPLQPPAAPPPRGGWIDVSNPGNSPQAPRGYPAAPPARGYPPSQPSIGYPQVPPPRPPVPATAGGWMEVPSSPPARPPQPAPSAPPPGPAASAAPMPPRGVLPQKADRTTWADPVLSPWAAPTQEEPRTPTRPVPAPKAGDQGVTECPKCHLQVSYPRLGSAPWEVVCPRCGARGKMWK